MDPYENLLNAIILQAVLDWREATAYLRRGKQRVRLMAALEMQKECEDFFLSEDFAALTDLDGPTLLERLRKEG